MQRVAGAVVEVGVKGGVVVVLDAEVLVTDAVADGEARGSLPLILRICGPVMKAIGAGKAGLADRKVDGAGRRLHEDVGVLVQIAGDGSLRVHRGLELVEIAGHKVCETLTFAFAELLVSLGVGAVGVIFLDVEDLSAELELVTTLGEAEVLVVLNGVLRAAGGQTAVAGGWRVKAGKLKGISGERIDASRVDVERRDVGQRGGVGLGEQIVAGKGELGERREGGGELMGGAEQISLTGGGLADVVLRVGAARGGTREVELVVVHVAEEGLGLRAEVVVQATGYVIGVLRETAAGIGRGTVEHVIVDRSVGGKTSI